MSGIGSFLPENTNVYKFGDCMAPRIGHIKIRNPTPNNWLIPITMDVMDVDVPVLIGLDFLDKTKDCW